MFAHVNAGLGDAAGDAEGEGDGEVVALGLALGLGLTCPTPPMIGLLRFGLITKRIPTMSTAMVTAATPAIQNGPPRDGVSINLGRTRSRRPWLGDPEMLSMALLRSRRNSSLPILKTSPGVRSDFNFFPAREIRAFAAAVWTPSVGLPFS